MTAPYPLQRKTGTCGFCTNKACYVWSDAPSGVTGAKSTCSNSTPLVALRSCIIPQAHVSIYFFSSTCPGLTSSARVSDKIKHVVHMAGSGHLDGKVTHTKTVILASRPTDDGRSEHGTPNIYRTMALVTIVHM